MTPEEVQELFSARLSERARRQITHGIDLDPGNSYPGRFRQSPAQRQAHRFQSNPDFHEK